MVTSRQQRPPRTEALRSRPSWTICRPRAACAFYRGVVLGWWGKVEAAEPDFAQALELSRQAGDRFRAYVSYGWRGQALLQVGELAAAERDLDRALGLADEVGTYFHRGAFQAYRAELELRRGRPALTQARAALAISDGLDWARSIALRVYGEALAAEDFAGGHAALQEARTLQRERECWYDLAWTELALARVTARQETSGAAIDTRMQAAPAGRPPIGRAPAGDTPAGDTPAGGHAYRRHAHRSDTRREHTGATGVRQANRRCGNAGRNGRGWGLWQRRGAAPPWLERRWTRGRCGGGAARQPRAATRSLHLSQDGRGLVGGRNPEGWRSASAGSTAANDRFASRTRINAAPAEDKMGCAERRVGERTIRERRLNPTGSAPSGDGQQEARAWA